MNFESIITYPKVTSYIKVKNDIIIHANNLFLKLSGYTKEEILNKDLSDVCTNLLRLTPSLDVSKKNSPQRERFIFTKDLDVLEVLINVLEDNDDVKIISFKEKPSSKLKDKLNFMESLYSNSKTGLAIYAITPDITLIRANETYLNFLDSPFNSKENSLGRKIDDIITGWKGSSSEDVWKKVLDNGQYIKIDEYKYDGFNKGTTYWKANLVPLYEDNRIKYAIEITEDITENVLNRQRMKKQALMIEEQKEELKKALMMKDEFFYSISHEFKTPLNIINSAVQAMELICGDELSERSKGFIKKIRQNSFRQLRLVNNILDITRMNSGHLNLNMKNIDIVFLTRAIVESVQLYAQEKGVKLSFKSTIKKRIIGVDDEKYERILLNLLSNAIKFTPRDKNIFVNLSFKDNKVFLSVEDMGIGIPKEKQGLIFERFGQVNSSLSKQSEGTGIGLSLVKLLVETLGGVINLESEEGKGSTFKIVLPGDKLGESSEDDKGDAIENRLVQSLNIEFSDIYA